jgi:hypothetical protein
MSRASSLRRSQFFARLMTVTLIAALPFSATMCTRSSYQVVQRDLDASPVVPDTHAGAWIDCVGELHVLTNRGSRVANAQRYGLPSSAVRLTDRIADLEPTDLKSFCDWEACITSNGYGHTCSVNDAGWERCRVCNGTSDCGGHPLTPDDCVAHAKDPGRAQCHVGLLEECLLQSALRGPADSRVSLSCAQSAEACAGKLPGDLSAQALAAQHETDQVTIQVANEELSIAAELQPDSSVISYWSGRLSLWDGGLPVDVDATAPNGDQ